MRSVSMVDRAPNVWTYAGANTFRAGRMQDLDAHPTVKPVAMVVDAIRDCSNRGDIIVDPFMGSGTTILAAERVGRRGYGTRSTRFTSMPPSVAGKSTPRKTLS